MSYFSHIYDGERENTRLNVKSEYGRMAFTKSFWYSHSNQPFTIYLAASHKAMKIISVCLAYFCFFYFATLVFLRHRNFISSLSIFFPISRSLQTVLCASHDILICSYFIWFYIDVRTFPFFSRLNRTRCTKAFLFAYSFFHGNIFMCNVFGITNFFVQQNKWSIKRKNGLCALCLRAFDICQRYQTFDFLPYSEDKTSRRALRVCPALIPRWADTWIRSYPTSDWDWLLFLSTEP